MAMEHIEKNWLPQECFPAVYKINGSFMSLICLAYISNRRLTMLLSVWANQTP